MGGRQGSRTHARAPLRDRGVRGRPRLRDGARGGGVPPPGPHRPAVQVGPDVLHGRPVHEGADPRDDARADRAQRPQGVLHPAGRLPRRRADGPVPARLPGRRLHRRLAVGRLPRRGGQAARRHGQDRLLAQDRAGRADPARQGQRPVPQLRAGQDRGRQGGLRGGHPARPARLRVRGHGREPVRDQGRRDRHAGLQLVDPRRHQPAVGDHHRARPRLRGRRARRRPRRALHRRRGVHDRHRRRADAAARDRRPADRHRRARPGHARGPVGVRGRAARPLRPLRRTGSTSCRSRLAAQ